MEDLNCHDKLVYTFMRIEYEANLLLGSGEVSLEKTESLYRVKDLVAQGKVLLEDLEGEVNDLECKIEDLEDDVKSLEDGKRDLEYQIEDLEEELEHTTDCDCEDELGIKLYSLADTMKMEFIASVFNEFTLEQLEERLKI